MADDGVSATVNKAQLEDLILANAALPEDTRAAIDEKMADASEELAAYAAQDAAATGRQAPLMIPTLRAVDGSVSFGGALPVGRHGVPAGVLAMGAEYGGVVHRQFPPLDPAGHILGSAFDADQEHLYDKMSEAADDAIDAWGAEGAASDADTAAKEIESV